MASVKRNLPLFYVITALHGLLFFLPIYALYLEQELFTVLNVGIIVSISAITAAVLEIPGGIIADKLGRKNAIILSSLLFIIEIFVLSIGGSFAVFVAFALIQGVAVSLFSGTEEALIYDSLAQVKQEKRFKKSIAILFTIWPASAAVGSFAGAFMAQQSLRLPIYLTLIPLTIAFVLSLFLVEPKYQKPTTTVYGHFKEGLLVLLRNKQVRLITAVGLLLFAFYEVLHTFKPLFFEFKGIPLELFGVFFGVTFILSAAGSFSTDFLSRRFGTKRTILTTFILGPIFIFLATLAPGAWAGVLVTLGSILWGIQMVLMSTIMNDELKSSHRATVISMSNLVNKAGILVSAPLFGYLTDVYSINSTYVVVALCSLSVVVVASFLKEPADATTSA